MNDAEVAGEGPALQGIVSITDVEDDDDDDDAAAVDEEEEDETADVGGIDACTKEVAGAPASGCGLSGDRGASAKSVSVGVVCCGDCIRALTSGDSGEVAMRVDSTAMTGSTSNAGVSVSKITTISAVPSPRSQSSQL